MNNNEEANKLNEEALESVSGGIENAVYNSIVSAFETKCGIDRSSINKSSVIDDLGADSLDVVDIVSAIETEFKVDFKELNLNKSTTVGDLCKDIVSKNKN